MKKASRILALAVMGAFCVLLTAGIAFGIQIPEKLKGIPLYQGSTVQQTMDMTNQTMLIAVVEAKSEDVAAFYRKTMNEKGWKTAFQMAAKSAETMQFTKDKQILQITVQQDKGASTTTYTMALSSE